MSRTIDADLLQNPDIVRFARLAAEFCCTIEKVESLPKYLFLRQVAEKLPLLYSVAYKLSDPYVWRDDEIDNDDRPTAGILGNFDVYKGWSERIGSKVEPYRWFSFVHDPVSLDDKEVITGDLGDILADVYLGLLDGSRLFEQPSDEEKAAGIWSWRFWLDLGWGEEAAEVLLPIHHILNTHYDDDDEVFDR